MMTITSSRSDRHQDQRDPPREWRGLLQTGGSGRRAAGLVAAVRPAELSADFGKLVDSQPCSCNLFLAIQPVSTDRSAQSSGRLTVPYVLLYYLPENCNPSSRMMYAGAVELMRNTAEVNRVIEIESESDVLNIEAKLTGSE